jgi:hemerythrin superfamily protein
MNAIDLLMRDHRTVEKLFSELQAATSAERERLFRQLNEELRTHTEAEEEAFYPSLPADSGDLVNRSIQEHAAVRRLLRQLLGVDVDSDRFDRDFTALMKDVQTHIREEEEPGGLMDVAREQLTASALDAIGGEIERVKADLRRQMVA